MSYSRLIEMFAKSADNCGIGSKGFEKGNECAKGKGASKAKASTSSPKAKSSETPQKTVKSASLDKSSKHRDPSPSGRSLSPRSGDEGYPVKRIAESPKFKAQVGSIMKGEIPPAPSNLSERAKKALAAHKPVTLEMKEKATVQERAISDGIGGNWMGNRVPTDFTLEHEGTTYGIEVKTEFNNEKGILTIDANAAKLKIDWAKKNKSRIDIVVVEHSTGKMYYKRGVGSFSIKGMHEVKDLKELKSLIIEKDENKLPENARMNKDTIYYKSFHDPKVMADLEAKALLAKIAKNARKQKSRDKQKAERLAAMGQK